MRFPSRYVLLVLAPLALSTGCSSRSIFKNSSGESVFSFKKKDKEAEDVAKADSKGDAKADPEKTTSGKPKESAARDSKDLAAKEKSGPKSDSPKEKGSSDASSSKLAKAHELEKKGDYDGAARLYREILAEDPRKVATTPEKGEKGTTRPASASGEDKPKVLAKKPDSNKSVDPWLNDLEPLPSTHPKGDKAGAAGAGAAGAGKNVAAAAPSSKPDWAKRAADPKTSASDRQLIENAMKSSDPEELDELADLLDIDEEEAPARPVNKFAQRDAERQAASDEEPSERRVAMKAETDSDSGPAWAKSRPAPSVEVAATPASKANPSPWNRSEGEKSSPADKTEESTESTAQSFPWNRPEAEKSVVDKEPVAEQGDSAGPAWKPTRTAQRELAARSAGPFEKPVAQTSPLEETIPKETAAAPALGETASISSRPGWNTTSMERLCRDCDPLVLAQVKKLDSSQADVRKEGIIELTRMGSIARPAGLALRSMLDDPDPMVQAYAAWGLWELENETLDSVQVLGGLLANNRPEVVELACYSLGNMGATASEAVPALQELRDNNHGVERLRAAEALIRVQGADARSVDVLTVAIKSTDRQVRWIAANGLGHVRGSQASRAVETLTLALDDTDPEVQAAAALALGGMGETARKSLPKLKELKRSSTPFVRDAADSAIQCLERE